MQPVCLHLVLWAPIRAFHQILNQFLRAHRSLAWQNYSAFILFCGNINFCWLVNRLLCFNYMVLWQNYWGVFLAFTHWIQLCVSRNHDWWLVDKYFIVHKLFKHRLFCLVLCYFITFSIFWCWQSFIEFFQVIRYFDSFQKLIAFRIIYFNSACCVRVMFLDILEKFPRWWALFGVFLET